eukprot:1995499-Prorocentrum_lima.AAC.1
MPGMPLPLTPSTQTDRVPPPHNTPTSSCTVTNDESACSCEARFRAPDKLRLRVNSHAMC